MTKFIPIALAAKIASNGAFAEVGRNAVLSAIFDEIIEARAYRAKISEMKFSESESDGIRKEILKFSLNTPIPINWMIGDGFSGNIEESYPFNYSNAFPFIGIEDDAWKIDVRNGESRREYKSDWKLGKFHTRILIYHDRHFGGEEEMGFKFYEYEWFGVEVEEDAVNRLLAPIADSLSAHQILENEPTETPTIYDWEAAFSDVAAALHFDVDIPNPSARGVQTEIVRLLRRSFLKRGAAEPGETMLKAKALKIQSALRSYQSE